MATIQNLPLIDRVFMKGYRFSRYAIDPVPCAKLNKPLSECRFALVTTAGLHVSHQQPFDKSIKKGDDSFREIPGDIEIGSLRESQRSRSFDHTAISLDRNVAFPLDRFRELVERRIIGELNRRHFSFMGSIISPGRLIAEKAPEVARMLREDGVDAVFLTPV